MTVVDWELVAIAVILVLVWVCVRSIRDKKWGGGGPPSKASLPDSGPLLSQFKPASGGRRLKI